MVGGGIPCLSWFSPAITKSNDALCSGACFLHRSHGLSKGQSQEFRSPSSSWSHRIPFWRIDGGHNFGGWLWLTSQRDCWVASKTYMEGRMVAYCSQTHSHGSSRREYKYCFKNSHWSSQISHRYLTDPHRVQISAIHSLCQCHIHYVGPKNGKNLHMVMIR